MALLHYAAIAIAFCGGGKGMLAVVQCLLASDAVAEAAGQRHNGKTALEELLESVRVRDAFEELQFADVVRCLLTCETIRATAGAQDARGRTPLMYATWKPWTRDSVIVELLACSSVRETAGCVDDTGKTALFNAAGSGSPQTAEALLACEQVWETANATTRSNGRTALMEAAFEKDARMLRALLTCESVRQGAGLRCSHSGKTALMLCVSSIEHYSDKAAVLECVDVLLDCPQAALTAGVADNRGYTALMLATRALYADYDDKEKADHATLIRRLLACASVAATAHAVNNAGKTALQYALAETNNPAVVGCLRDCNRNRAS